MIQWKSSILIFLLLRGDGSIVIELEIGFRFDVSAAAASVIIIGDNTNLWFDALQFIVVLRDVIEYFV